VAKEHNRTPNNESTASTETPPAPVAPVALAAPAAAATTESTQGRAIILPNGERRVDFIKRRFKELTADPATKTGARGKIVKELKAMGHDVAYQIVFAATKGDKPAAPAATPAAPAAAQ